ncbi:MAG: putative DNA-binding domain-containing protein [gamma proteobacterium symbiont of Bathyaustriella thionipta]|nr:putative DNA-binding domain-containing protein [gamma proteobacterium symbiont of Bathyaustriella thionipta]
MPDRPAFMQQQYEFAAHIRNPQQVKTPAGIEERRMAIYRDLFFNNIEGFLSDSFPVLKSILSESHWQDMARDFFIRHRCKTPLFLEIAEEFIDYLSHERKKHAHDPAFMLELAHYEWLELALDIAEEDELPDELNANGDVLQQAPYLSSLLVNVSYDYPVHQLSPDFIPDKKPDSPTHLLVYRNRNDEVKFLHINAVTQRLLQLLQENPHQTGLAQIEIIARELNHPQPQQVIQAGSDILSDLHARGIILGTTRNS